MQEDYPICGSPLAVPDILIHFYHICYICPQIPRIRRSVSDQSYLALL